MRITFTDLAIRKISSPQKGQKKVYDLSTPGFGIVIGKNTKTFVVVTGKERRVRTIGRYPQISLSNARKQAKILLANPISFLHEKRLHNLIAAFYEDCSGRMRNSSLERYRDVLKKAPDIAIRDVTKRIATTAHEIKTYKALFNFALREDVYHKNPFQHVSAVYGQRDRVLTEEELIKIWQYEKPPFSNIVKLLILTGQRRGQIWNIQPEWIKEDTIVFPSDVMKQGKTHTIPIGKMTLKHLKSVPFQFNAWSKSKSAMDSAVGVRNYTLHDLRRTYATIHAKLGTPIHIVEALLAHSSGQISGVTAIYIRHNWLAEMRKAVARYDTWLSSRLHAPATLGASSRIDYKMDYSYG